MRADIDFLAAASSQITAKSHFGLRPVVIVLLLLFALPPAIAHWWLTADIRNLAAQAGVMVRDDSAAAYRAATPAGRGKPVSAQGRKFAAQLDAIERQRPEVIRLSAVEFDDNGELVLLEGRCERARQVTVYLQQLASETAFENFTPAGLAVERTESEAVYRFRAHFLRRGSTGP